MALRKPVSRRATAAIGTALTLALVSGTSSVTAASAARPSGNAVQQWDKIAEDTVVGSGAFQNESQIYMANEATAVYDAVVAIEGGYKPYGPAIDAPVGASAEAAVAEAAYRTLIHYFPASTFPTLAQTLIDDHAEALAAIPDSQSKSDGVAVGHQAADDIIGLRNGDGRLTPIATTSSFPTKPAGPGVWRRTPPFAAPQTPWVGNVRPWVLKSGDQFQPPPPPALSSDEWATAYDEIKLYGQNTSTARSAAETAVARFWTANAVRQYNRAARELATARGLGLLETARLMAMLNVVASDAQIAVMNAKYHYLLWRPVTAIDPTAVTDDGYGPVPGFEDGNPATAPEIGWRPLVVTPNHPEYPAAHGSLTSAMAEVFSQFLGTTRIDLDIHGFDASGVTGNFDAVRHFERANDLRREIVNARLWAGLHYRFSGEAGVALGRSVAKYDLRHAFQPAD
jgi:hypothetical protein